MRYLGVDFGSKRVGLAISDATNVIAVPLKVLPNNKELLTEIDALCRELQIGALVVGESNNYQGVPNPIMKKIEKFRKEAEEKLRIPVEYEPEVLSSALAARLQGKSELLDAAAAAIILQSYLDKGNGMHRANGDADHPAAENHD